MNGEDLKEKIGTISLAQTLSNSANGNMAGSYENQPMTGPQAPAPDSPSPF